MKDEVGLRSHFQAQQPFGCSYWAGGLSEDKQTQLCRNTPAQVPKNMHREQPPTITPVTQRETVGEKETQVCLISLTAKLQIKFIYKLNTLCPYSFSSKFFTARKHCPIPVATKELSSILRFMHTPSCSPENKEATVLAATDLTSSRILSAEADYSYNHFCNFIRFEIHLQT